MNFANEKLSPLERYFTILEVLCGYSDGLTLTELAKMLALPKASIHRLLATMQKSNLVAFNGGSTTYVLGERARRLVHLSAGSEFVKALTSSHLQQLSSETGETCYIARLEGSVVRTVAMESPNAPWRGFVLPGKIMQPHATACARAILAFQPDELVDQALSGDLARLTRHTKTDRMVIKDDLAEIRRKGVSMCIGEVDEGLAAAAVPIDVKLTGVIYALGIVGPLPRITHLISQNIASRLVTVAEAISECLSKTGSEISNIS